MNLRSFVLLCAISCMGLVTVLGASHRETPATTLSPGAGSTVGAESCMYVNQRDYRGQISKTRSGRTCQPWDSQYPHIHNYTSMNYPKAGLESNYCRNPSGMPHAWCFTNDPTKRWEECEIACPEKTFTKGCCRFPSQVDYRGNLATTANGYSCQSWTEQTPHEHIKTSERYYKAGLDKAACRNPDGMARAWCYLNTTETHKSWDFCNLECDASECCKDSKLETDYRGKTSITASGDSCIRWDERCPLGETATLENGTVVKVMCSKPPSDKYEIPAKFSRADMDIFGKHNYCRNPDGDTGGAWCFTGNPVHPWDYCDIECVDTAPQSCLAKDSPAHTKPQASHVPLNIAFGSCSNMDPIWNDGGRDPDFWSNVVEHKPDMWIWLGDVVYANTFDTDEKCSKMQRDYMRLKEDVGYKKLLEAQIPVMSIWDDHDFGLNNEGKWYARKEESKKRHLEFFDVKDPARLSRDGVYNSQFFDDGKHTVRVVLVDGRFNRSPTFSTYGKCEGLNSTLLGEKQWKWLEEELVGDKLPNGTDLLILGSGIQVLPPAHIGFETESFKHCAMEDKIGNASLDAIREMEEEKVYGSPDIETWSNAFPTERARLLKLVRDAVTSHKYKKVVIISGDTHWGEIQSKKIPGDEKQGSESVEVFEITASGIRNRNRQLQPNFHRLSVSADIRGNADYYWGGQCVFPFVYNNTSFKNCTAMNNGFNNGQMWCPTRVSYPDRQAMVGEGHWGVCAPEGARTKWGKQGRVGADESQWNAHPYVINEAISNYGNIKVDFEKNEIRLQVRTPHATRLVQAETVLEIKPSDPPARLPVPPLPTDQKKCESKCCGCCSHVHSSSCCDSTNVCDFAQGNHDIHTVLHYDPEKKFLVNDKKIASTSTSTLSTPKYSAPVMDAAPLVDQN